MKRKHVALSLGAALVIASGVAYASIVNPRAGEVTEFYPGHTHIDGTTNDAPQHSGGTDAYGCHNGSVAYHCH